MASAVDICNLALAHLGDEATVADIAPSDGSQQADLCVRFYPIARDQLLGLHEWSFATRRIPLAELDTDELPDTWLYAYAAPGESVTVFAILPSGSALSIASETPLGQAIPSQAGDQNVQPFVQETLQNGDKVIFTNTPEAIARYAHAITDTTKFTPLFVAALARLLSSYLAGPIIKGSEGRKVAAAEFKTFLTVEFPAATAHDQKGQRVTTYNDFIPQSLQARQ